MVYMKLTNENMQLKDFCIGTKYGKLTIIGPVELVKGRRSVLCQCDCENKNIITKICSVLKRRIGLHCGCLHPQKKKGTNVKNGYKKCHKCLEIKTIDKFTKSSFKEDGYSGRCKDCDREKYYIKAFGITLAQYNEMLASQDNKCYICKSESSETNQLDIDHSHSTGKIRKLLCHFCNCGIGCFNESVDNLTRAKNYLSKYNDNKNMQ